MADRQGQQLKQFKACKVQVNMKSTKGNKFSELVPLKADKCCSQSCRNDNVECDILTSK